MWYVILKLVANCKDDVWLIKMVNFKAVILFIRILTEMVKSKSQKVKLHKEDHLQLKSYLSKTRDFEPFYQKLY